MGQKSWPEERAEIAIWLSGFLGTYKKWVDKILDNDDHDVTKNKIIDLLPLISGGGQEFGIRSGTTPVPLIVGLLEASKFNF